MMPAADRFSLPCRWAKLNVGCAALLAVLLFWLGANPVHAHQMRLAYLQLSEAGPDTYDIYWKRSTGGDVSLRGLSVQLPASCNNSAEPSFEIAADSVIEQWQIYCPKGLADGVVRVEGLAETSADVLVRMDSPNGASQVVRLSSEQPGFTVAASGGAFQVAGSYLVLGVEHILLGLDHLLFVLALLLLVRGTGVLIATVTAFTIAHSITLALATFGVVSVPIAPMEAVVALSIVFLASEIVHQHRGKSSLTARLPWLVAFAFGLLHGLGFASALSDVGLPQAHIPLALLFFNLGVEVGQLLFIAVAFATFLALRRLRSAWPSWAVLAPPYAIGSVAMFWVFQRIAIF